MERKILFIIVAVLLAASAGAATSCEDRLVPGRNCTMFTPSIVCSNYTYDILNETGVVLDDANLTLVNESVYRFSFNQQVGSYLVRLCDDSTREIIVEGEDDMASLAITLFILVCAGFLFAVPWFPGELAKNKFADLIMKRCCWILAIYLMMLNSAIMATIADFAGLNLTNEMFRYMWLFGMAGYLLMGYTVLKTFFDIIEMWKASAAEKRMGGAYE